MTLKRLPLTIVEDRPEALAGSYALGDFRGRFGFGRPAHGSEQGARYGFGGPQPRNEEGPQLALSILRRRTGIPGLWSASSE